MNYTIWSHGSPLEYFGALSWVRIVECYQNSMVLVLQGLKDTPYQYQLWKISGHLQELPHRCETTKEHDNFHNSKAKRFPWLKKGMVLIKSKQSMAQNIEGRPTEQAGVGSKYLKSCIIDTRKILESGSSATGQRAQFLLVVQCIEIHHSMML